MITKIYMVRHTQTIGNVEKRLTGRKDFEVTEDGKRYNMYLTERLKNIKFDAAYASTSKRSSKTIQKLAELNHLQIKELDDLCEMYFGIYDGMKWSDVNQINPEIHKLHMETNKIMTIPEQESTEDVTKRMNKIMLQIANENLGKTVLICSHGVAIEAFLRSVTGVPFLQQIKEYSQTNTSLNILTFDGDTQKFTLELLNDLSHLKGGKK